MSIRSEVLRSPLHWPSVALHICDVLWRRKNAPQNRRIALRGTCDPEIIMYEDRGNWLFAFALEDGVDAASRRFVSLLSRNDLVDDSYSSSQRLVNACYLKQIVPDLKLTDDAMKQLQRDARRVCDHFEFRLENTWFNNHLLNNYRALVLARSILDLDVDSSQVLKEIDCLLVRYADTLYDDARGPILAEGSVSYELFCLRALIDIAQVEDTYPFAQFATQWLARDAVTYAARYRFKARWILPKIGDLCPDWRLADMYDFLDGTMLGKNTLYRQVWGTSLDSYAQEFSMVTKQGGQA